MREKKILNLLGFASRSRSFVFGKDGIRAYIRGNQKNKIIIIASDTGDAVKEDTVKRCKSHGIIYYILKDYNKEDLSNAMGKLEISVVGVTDENLAAGIIDLEKNGGENDAKDQSI